jgi:ketosteroid isomerase-like protein
MLKFILTAIAMTAAVLPAAAEDVPATIIALERAALDASDHGDVKPMLAITAPDVVYQDPALDSPIVGLEALTAYYAKMPPFEPAHGEMLNSKVQVQGDVAVLSFHYVVRQQEKVIREWNCTEVYRKTGGNWRTFNTHWSLTKPMPQKFM